ncbi:MAG: hypothetical protein ACOC0B_02305, partial [bacterium]
LAAAVNRLLAAGDSPVAYQLIDKDFSLAHDTIKLFHVYPPPSLWVLFLTGRIDIFAFFRNSLAIAKSSSQPPKLVPEIELPPIFRLGWYRAGITWTFRQSAVRAGQPALTYSRGSHESRRAASSSYLCDFSSERAT